MCPSVMLNDLLYIENPTSQIFRNTSGSQAKLEKTHTYQAQTTRITTRENILTIPQKIITVD